ncbi:MAG: FkbM family methyltransferase [Flavobacteriales bacterium]
MIQSIKNIVKGICIAFKIDLTKNIKYDRLTSEIFKMYLSEHSNTIDVGCHKGEVMDEILKCSPSGMHFGFEPITPLYNNLTAKYTSHANVKISNVALSNVNEKAVFNYVTNAPAYSGLKKREYAVSNPKIEKIDVQCNLLDQMNINESIDLIKIDVEGAELLVLQGAVNFIKKNTPIIILEFGKGASDFYGTSPELFFNFVDSELNMNISTLEGFIKKNAPIKMPDFQNMYENNLEYYFVIHPS